MKIPYSYLRNFLSSELSQSKLVETFNDHSWTDGLVSVVLPVCNSEIETFFDKNRESLFILRL